MHQFNRISVTFSLLLIISNIITSIPVCDCPAEICCSKWGYCGLGAGYCDDGCRAGPCWFDGDAPNGSYTGRMTWYNVSVGLTACGSRHGDDELVLDLNERQFDPYTPDWNPNHNTLCNRKIQVNGPHDSAQVQLVDMCPGCPYAGLDLSPATFEIIGGSLDTGVFQATWHFI